jgi:hypothetical protein
MLTTVTHELEINIGGIPILVRTESPAFVALLQERYSCFAHLPRRVPDHEPQSRVPPVYELEIELIPSRIITEEPDVSVRRESRWVMERGDFRAEWDPASGRGWVRQTPNPNSIDSVLRILHSLVLAREGGFMVHAASAVRNGRAFLFSGASGAGKTTISRLAPPDVLLLTDEISYVREVRNQRPEVSDAKSYEAFGTPFAGALARLGEGVRAPVAALYFLAQGPENRIEPLARTDAARRLLRNILFFAPDDELVRKLFDSVLDFVSRVAVCGLVFAPDARVWELIV